MELPPEAKEKHTRSKRKETKKQKLQSILDLENQIQELLLKYGDKKCKPNFFND